MEIMKNNTQKKLILPVILLILFLLSGCGKENKVDKPNYGDSTANTTQKDSAYKEAKEKFVFSLKDFFSNEKNLDKKVDSVFKKMTDDERIAQMIICAAGKYGKSSEQVVKLIQSKQIGGVLLLKGDKAEFKEMVRKFNETALSSKSLPLLYSADAEPGLINIKIAGIKDTPYAEEIPSEEKCADVADDIVKILRDIGINQNFAPVCDFPYNREIIGNRSFGADTSKINSLASIFIQKMQDNNIIATAKHFPGHGNVKGDSHKGLVYIDGNLVELDVFSKIINSGVISVMVGHIAVKNNKKYDTGGLPATMSSKIITNLLKDELKFKGLIVTDAMNMSAVSNLNSPSLMAVMAGCDIILMPSDEAKLISSVKLEIERNPILKEQIYNSVKKIIRAKICLGLI
jgi:beta-N-acetylhexosaminidase